MRTDMPAINTKKEQCMPFNLRNATDTIGLLNRMTGSRTMMLSMLHGRIQ